MNLEQLQDKIDRIIAWRKKELSYLLEDAETSKGFSQSVAIRTGYVLTYAHFEGAIKELATLYIKYVFSQKIELNKLTMNFMVISINEKDLKLLSETTKIEARAQIIENILNLKKSKDVPYKKIINTESNLKSEVFQNILNTVNFEKSKYELNYNFIDAILLNTRNNIAHGSILERNCDIEQFKECYLKVHKLITDFSEDVYNYALEKKYMSIVRKKVITINKNKINIDFSELEKEINNSKISSKELVEVVNVKTTMEPVSNELIIFKDNKCIANYIIESGNKSSFSNLKFLHLCIRILNNFALMIDGEIDDSPFKTEKKINQIDGIRFQPVLLNVYNNDNAENKGMGLFRRGLHFSGFITPSNFRLCCICDECKKSFNIHSYHAGNGYFQYFYSDDGSETLMVPYGAIKDMPGQLCKNISEESVKRIDSQLEKKGYGRFKFYNPFRCPYCKAPYIDFQKHPEIREYEYYANVFLNKEMIEYKEKK